MMLSVPLGKAVVAKVATAEDGFNELDKKPPVPAVPTTGCAVPTRVPFAKNETVPVGAAPKLATVAVPVEMLAVRVTLVPGVIEFALDETAALVAACEMVKASGVEALALKLGSEL